MVRSLTEAFANIRRAPFPGLSPCLFRGQISSIDINLVRLDPRASYSPCILRRHLTLAPTEVPPLPPPSWLTFYHLCFPSNSNSTIFTFSRHSVPPLCRGELSELREENSKSCFPLIKLLSIFYLNLRGSPFLSEMGLESSFLIFG